jgi:hypothetical protein
VKIPLRNPGKRKSLKALTALEAAKTKRPTPRGLVFCLLSPHPKLVTKRFQNNPGRELHKKKS